MELIDITQAMRDLDALGADETSKELVLNNIKMYNGLVLDYTVEGITKNLYLTYQLNVQISKQISDLKKFNRSKTIEEEESGLPDLIKSLRGDDKPLKKAGSPKPIRR